MPDEDRFTPRMEALIAELEERATVLGLPALDAYRCDPSLDLSVVRAERSFETPIGVTGGSPDLRFEDWLRFWYHGARTLEFDTAEALPSLDPSGEEFAAAIALARRLGPVLFPDRGGAPPLAVQFRISTRPTADVQARGPSSFRDQVEALRQQGKDWRRLGLDCLVVRPVPIDSVEETETLVRILLKEMDVEVILELDPTVLGRGAAEEILAGLPSPPRVRKDAFQDALPFDEAMAAIRRLRGYAARDVHRFAVRIGGTIATEAGPLSGRPLYLLGLATLDRVRSRIGPEVPVGFAADAEPFDVVRLAEAGVAPVLVRAGRLGEEGATRIADALFVLEERMKEVGVATVPDLVLKGGEWGRDALSQAFGEVSEAFRESRADWPEEVREAARRQTDEVAAEMLANLDSEAVELSRVLREGIARLRGLLAPWDTLPVVEDHLHRLAEVRLRARDLAGALATPEVVARAAADARARIR